MSKLQSIKNYPSSLTPLWSNSWQRVYLEMERVTPSVSFIACWYHSVLALESAHMGFMLNLLSCESDRIPEGKRDLSTPSLRRCAKPPEAHCHMFNSLSFHGRLGNVPIILSNRSVIGHRGTLLLPDSIFTSFKVWIVLPLFPLSLLLTQFKVNQGFLKGHGRLLWPFHQNWTTEDLTPN